MSAWTFYSVDASALRLAQKVYTLHGITYKCTVRINNYTDIHLECFKYIQRWLGKKVSHVNL